MKKQMDYADAKKIPYVIIAGEDEIKKDEITIKNMQSGEQKKIGLGELESFFR
jgi:histidyl-tRNA synthetase